MDNPRGVWLARGESALPVGLLPLLGLLRLLRWRGHWLLRRYWLAGYRFGWLWLLLCHGSHPLSLAATTTRPPRKRAAMTRYAMVSQWFPVIFPQCALVNPFPESASRQWRTLGGKEDQAPSKDGVPGAIRAKAPGTRPRPSFPDWGLSQTLEEGPTCSASLRSFTGTRNRTAPRCRPRAGGRSLALRTSLLLRITKPGAGSSARAPSAAPARGCHRRARPRKCALLGSSG